MSGQSRRVRPILRRACLTMLSLTVMASSAVVSGVPFGSEPAQAAPWEGRIGSQGGFSGSWQLLWMNDSELNWELDGMARSGARWLRVDFNWPALQPTPTSWNWQSTDRVVRAATARGLQVLAMPAYTPAWARGAGTDDKHPPGDRQTYARFVQEAVRRYRPMGVSHWQIWNEPNQWHWWKPRPDPWAYTDLLWRAFAAIKAVDPNATVIAAGMAPAPDAADGSEINGATFARRMYQAGARGNFDALAMHPYNYPVEPMYPAWWNAFYATAPAIHQIMAENGDGWKKVWLTEYGAPTTGPRGIGEDRAAEYLVKAYNQVVNWPWAGPLLYYTYRDLGWDINNSGDNFGLIRRDWSWKRGMSAFIDTMAKPISAAQSRLTPGQLLHSGSSLKSPDLRYSLAMQTDGNLVLYNPGGWAIWSTGTYWAGGASLSMQNDGNLVLYDRGGRAIWSTGTYWAPGSSLVLQNDGNLVLYDRGGRAIWATNTYGR